jgi:hypothetical protein
VQGVFHRPSAVDEAVFAAVGAEVVRAIDAIRFLVGPAAKLLEFRFLDVVARARRF